MARTKQEEISYLIHCLANPRLAKANRAQRRLIAIGPDAVEQLIEAAKSQSKEVRLHAAWALGQIRDPRGFEAILEQTHDPDSFVRYEAAWALGCLGDERAIAPLIEYISGNDEGGAGGGAAQGFHLLGQKVVKPLLEILESGNSTLKQTAAFVLAQIGDEEVIEPIAKLLDSPEEWERIAAIESLELLGSDHPHTLGLRCLELIEKCVKDPVKNVREDAEYLANELNRVMTNQKSTVDLSKLWTVRQIAIKTIRETYDIKCASNACARRRRERRKLITEES